MNIVRPVREVVNLPPPPFTTRVEIVSCAEEQTCNLQVMFDNGFRISIPVEHGDTAAALRARILLMIAEYRPTSGDTYARTVSMMTKALGESLGDADGNIDVIGFRVATLIPRWEVNLFWSYLEELEIPVTIEDALDVLREEGLTPYLLNEESPSSPF